MKARFPIGLTFNRKRFPKAKELTEYTIDDVILSVSVKTGKTFALEYSISHEFMGQPISERVGDTTIARAIFDNNPEHKHLVTGENNHV